MRVTFVLECADLAGGVRVVAEHARRLMRRGHEVLVVSTPNPTKPLRLCVSHLIKTGKWPVFGVPGESHLDGSGVPHLKLARYRPVRGADLPDADAVVATTWRTGHWVAALPESKGAKLHLKQHHETWAGWDARTGCPASWRLPTHKVVISRWLADLCRQTYGQECSVVPNAVDTELFFPAGERRQQRTPTVGMLYHDLAFKGIDVAIRTLAQVRNRLPGLNVVAFGREAPVPSLPLPDGTTYHRRPAQSSLREIYSACDVWMCASRAEGFHLPPLEAMACGTPVVSTEVGGPLDVVDDGVNGHLVPVGDAERLAAKVVRVLTLPADLWGRMSASSLRTARAYTWEDASLRLEKAIRRAVLEQAGSGRREPLAAGGW